MKKRRIKDLNAKKIMEMHALNLKIFHVKEEHM